MVRPMPIMVALAGATLLFGAWAAVLVFVGWRPEAPFLEGAGSWPLVGSPWLPGLLWLAASGVALALLRRRAAVVPVPAPISPTWRAPAASPGPPRVPPSLDAFLNPGRTMALIALTQAEDGSWHAVAKAAAAIRKLRIFVDHAPVPPKEVGRAAGPIRVELATLSDVADGQEIRLPVLRLEGGTWRVASPEEVGLASEPMHRCRLAVSADERELQSLYFVILPLAGCTTPIIVDESVFRFKDAWEAEAPLLQTPRWRGR